MSTTERTPTRISVATGPVARWRTIDLLTAAMVGVAFGVVFWGWGVVYSAVVTPLTTFFQPASGLVGGVWLMPAVIAALIVRRPGAALLAELVAANVEFLLGSHWSTGVLISGAVQGLGVELAVAALAWKRWGVGVAVLAGIVAATAESVYEWFAYIPEWSFAWKLAYLGFFAVSGALLAGVLGHAIVQALARAGALRRFPVAAELRARTRV
ncbi:ECF transporter S component [Kineococcus gynurae]|uniref:ECF transporter S component n=1 Tax=Kineococcus gynurae TaxID=452979 RepID=A0ABV5LQ18_9ACTN